jgi:CheY-like chemotaxis protein
MGFSRQERLELKPTDLAQLVTEMSTMLQRLLPENIEIWVVTDRPVPTVMVDPHAVEQIILNTATNSRDAMPEGGLLKIQIYKSWLDEDYCVLRPGCEPGEYVCIAVSDTGIGMDEETKEHIFEPFFTTKQRGEGTGLGMSMLYGLITQHGGSVDVYSKPGEGTTVRMCFPAVKEPPSDRVPRERLSKLPGGTETILVVEDDMAIRRATVRTLEGHGYRVLAAADGEEGLELFRAHESEIALVLTDIVMPKLGGRELYEALKGEGKRVNVMFVSGYSSKDVVESKVLPSEVPLLNKPWTIPDLLARVREVLDRQVSV